MVMDRFYLRDVDVQALTICKKGANGQRFFLKKEHADENDLVVLPANQRIIKTADWSTVYCVVAEPGAVENGGTLSPEVEDVWKSEDEIRKAAHGFMANGGLVTKLHESLDPYGKVVENAVALADLTVENHTIKKGSWYVGLAPSEEGKELIEKGEFTGVSIEGTGARDPIAKTLDPDVRRAIVEAADLLSDENDSREQRARKILDDLAFDYTPPETDLAKSTLRRIGDYFGLTPKAGASERDTVATDEEEETVDQEQKDQIAKAEKNSEEALEKSSAAVTAINALKDTTDQILARLPQKEEEPPSPEDLKKALDTVTDDLGEKLDKIEKGIDALASGSSSQQDDDDERERRERVKKSDQPLAGLLFE